MANDFRLIAHRFFAGASEENSLEALRFSIVSGAKWVETDIHITRDGVPLLIHDERLDRTTDGCGLIKENTYLDISNNCRLSNGEPVPRLSDLLKMILLYDINAYLQINDPSGYLVILNEVRKHKVGSRVILSSFHHDALLRCKREEPDVKTMCLFECRPIDPVHILKQCGASEAGIGIDSATKELVLALEGNGIRSYAWTIRSRGDLEKVTSCGFHGAFVDFPWF